MSAAPEHAEHEAAVDYGEYADEGVEGLDGAEGEEGGSTLAPELAELQSMMASMEAEAKALADATSKVSTDAAATVAAKADLEAKQAERDERSLFVGNVDFSATAEELGKHFKTCGPVERVTILVDKATGHPKGFAYVEFVRKESVANGLVLNGSEFKGRALKVITKRTNVPSWQLRGRGRGGFRGGRGRGGYYRGGGGYFRGGGRGHFAPRGAPYRGRGRGRGY